MGNFFGMCTLALMSATLVVSLFGSVFSGLLFGITLIVGFIGILCRN